ncbi:MAG: hypothetical protein CVU56_00520 [Deltaproteobacteria bacterium HGW-Deltaproteobacteria-14]|jgi:hypothetical protein|nr:MAG: hypothetical protein CVU56_00520 [Deltaproteobacteria bacterium HGW-Deltaproteobacteria-14]
MLGHTMQHARFVAALLSALALAALVGGQAHAKSWCAYPLWVHEWGVHAFDGGGAPAPGGPLPAHFHTRADAPRAITPVRELPIDSGDRDLPVIHFYAPTMRGASIPVGLEVGFTTGAASAWFPAVDELRPAAIANGPASAVARTQLLAQRAARAGDSATWRGEAPTMPADPTRQLVWSRLDLTPQPASPRAPTDAAWVKTARDIGALWVNAGGESERFLFYEGKTVERVPLTLRRGDRWQPTKRQYVLSNTGAHPVHDVFVVHKDAGATYVFVAATIVAGASVAFVLDDHPARDVKAATVTALRDRLVDPAASTVPAQYQWDMDDCVMGRDPAVPTERAAGHHLYRAEADLLLDTWGERFFGQPGTTVVYREDGAYLDAVMPLSVYTDMFSFPVLHRAGLALWEHVSLP